MSQPRWAVQTHLQSYRKYTSYYSRDNLGLMNETKIKIAPPAMYINPLDHEFLKGCLLLKMAKPQAKITWCIQYNNYITKHVPN